MNDTTDLSSLPLKELQERAANLGSTEYHRSKASAIEAIQAAQAGRTGAFDDEGGLSVGDGVIVDVRAKGVLEHGEVIAVNDNGTVDLRCTPADEGARTYHRSECVREGSEQDDGRVTVFWPVEDSEE